jgi:hypothetical protein
MIHSRWRTPAGFVGLLLLAAATAGTAAEIEAGLPKKTTAVVTVNLKQLLHAPLVKHHALACLRQVCEDKEEVRVILDVLSLNPLRDLDRLTMASVGKGDKAECVCIVRGRFDTARIQSAAKQLVKEYGDRFEMHKGDGLKYLSLVETGGHGSVTFGAGANAKKGAVLNVETKGCLLDAFGKYCLALADKNTLVVASSKNLLIETCKHLGDKTSANLNKPMRRLLAEMDSKQTIAFAICPTPPTFETASTEDGKDEKKAPLRELTGGIVVADDFQLRCSVKTDSVEEARIVMKGFEEVRLRSDGLMTLLAGSSKEYAFLKDVPRSFLAVRKGRILLVEGRLPAETLNKILGACSFSSK